MYTLPNEQFNALEHAKNAVLRANQFAELVVQHFIMAYEDFWGLYPEGGSRYTAEQMQDKLEAMPMTTAVDILQDAAAFKTFISQAYPDTLPAKYHESAWDYAIDQQGLHVTQLRPVWEPAANVKWRKSVVGDGAAYNGNQPRLVMKRNDAVGIAADVVLATGTNAANGAWELIGGTSATFSDEGEVILCVDCDGTTGWLNIQEIAVGSESNDMTYWNDGLPVQYLSGSSGSSGSAFSYASS